jgi:DNA polymerase I-like protein with 3'-5' exonuclease and polymerase domains
MVRRIEDARQVDFALDLPPRALIPPDGWKTPESLPELDGLVAFDWETRDPGLGLQKGSSWPHKGEGFVCGAGLAWGTNTLYAPLNHAAGNMDPMLFWPWLRKQAAKPGVTFVMANSIYDAGWLKRHGIVLANSPVDVQAMAYLIDEHRISYSLNALSREYLGKSKSTAELKAAARPFNVFDPMTAMDRIPAWVAAPYGTYDAVLTLELYRKLLPQIIADDLMEVHTLEREAAMVAVDLRWRGVRVDLEQAELLRADFVAKRDAALQRIFDLTQVRCDPFESSEVMRALRAEDPNVQFGLTGNGNESAAQRVLQAIGTPVARAALDARRYDKAVSTFIDGYIREFVRPNGRIHAEFHPTRRSDRNDDSFDSAWSPGTTSGRFSCSNPNLQNIPTRDDEIGPATRSCYLPEEGEDWCKLDWSSQEPRISLHFAYKAHCRGAADMVQRFLDNPKTDLHGECATLMGIDRRPAKVINLAIAYGQMGASFCREMGLPTKTIRSRRTGQMIEVAGEEGQRLLDNHYRAVPFVREIFELAKRTAERRGWIKTLSGRRIHFKTYGDGNYARTHKALNAAVQGSAADQMKYALVGMRNACIPVLVTVHDEAGISLPPGAEGRGRLAAAIEIMETCLPISVPMVADYKIGRSWGEIA